MMVMMTASSSSSSVFRLSSVGLSARGRPLLSVSRPPSDHLPLPDVSSDHPLVDPAAGASPVEQEVVLEDGEVGGVGDESEGAAAECERIHAAADGEEGSGREQSADRLVQLGRRLPAETRARHAAVPAPPRKTASDHPRQQPHLHTAAVCTGVSQITFYSSINTTEYKY